MNIKNYIIVITIPFLLLSCSHSEDYELLINKTIDQTALQLNKEKSLVTVGSGGQMMGDIQLARVMFQYFHLVNLDEARELLVYVIQEFLKNINENKKLRPYLHNYPFTTKNIEILIFIFQPDGHEPSQENLAVISLQKGTLKYKLSPPSEFARYPILHEETYSEALEILNEHP